MKRFSENKIIQKARIIIETESKQNEDKGHTARGCPNIMECSILFRGGLNGQQTREASALSRLGIKN